MAAMEPALVLTPPQQRTSEVLLASDRTRPVFDADLAGRLRASIEDELGVMPRSVYLNKGRLGHADRCEGRFEAALLGEGPPFEHSPKTASGLVLHKVVELEICGREERDPHALALLATERLVADDTSFTDYWGRLDEVAKDELVMRGMEALVLFRESFPPLRPQRGRLAPMTEWRFRADLLGGDLVLDGRVDLSLGRQEPPAAGRLLIDLKAEGAWAHHVEDMRFYALVHTLRFGIPPYRVATVFLTSGEWQVEDVSEATLVRAADRVVAGARLALRLAQGESAQLVPGRYCAWCPRSATCPAAASAG